ncbi:hypothetical protein [Winogradskyella endarachnes]|uniref:Uncharacterized protein n=1 Tax=Winogradskyella endarachnes TaxID=2681965 RepID=A0A6L6U5P1_9FLAO|nr:hypothetical protein [Winogradskyella endarachnes]MUU77418.1 hypothetical protein [Winogradskyella endarachnes]
MKFFKVLLFTLIVCQFTESQNENKYVGFIKLKDTLLIKYRLEFSESNGEISGYSLTDFGGEHETKSKISGIYDQTNHRISFKEVELIYTKSPVSLDDFDFCNIHLESAKFKLGANEFNGNFKGKFSDGTQCINGELAMSSVEKVANRVAKFSKKVQKSKRIEDSIKDKMKNLKILDSLNLNVLKKNEVTSVFTKSKVMKFFIYDGGKIDKDVVTILSEGKIVLLNYEISENKKVIEIPIKTKKTTITIISNSVGTIGTNTTVLEIVDDVNKIKTLTSLNKDEKTYIDIFQK